MARKIILLESVELIRPKKALFEIIENSLHPVVVIAENPYSTNLLSSKNAKHVKFSRIDQASIKGFLNRICINESVKVDEKILDLIAKTCQGDMRSALIDLDMMKNGLKMFEERTISYNIFDVVKSLFSGKNEESRKMMENYNDIDSLFFWIEENIQKEYKNPEDLSRTYENLAKADTFRSLVVKRQSWNLEKYVSDFFIYGMSKKRRISIATYASPKRLFGMDQNTLEKISHAFHVSKKGSYMYIDVIKPFLADENFCKSVGLDEDEIETIRDY